MTPEEIHALLVETHDNAVVSWDAAAKNPTLTIASEAAADVLAFLKNDSRTAFDMLVCLSGYDLGDRLAVAYHLFSFRYRHTFVVKTTVRRDDPRVPSVALVWRGARWFEREAFDLFGIVFEGNPDLRRILLPEDWEGFPLRKDYVYPTHYAGIDNRREYD